MKSTRPSTGRHNVIEKLCPAIVLIIAVLLIPNVTHAASHYVRSGAPANGNGGDWANAYTDLPANLVRGDTYYVAKGNYKPHTFGDPTSGTLVITIKAATAADHGTDVGWSGSYVGQALFTAPLNFSTDNYVLNGQYRNDFRSGYGFKVNNNNGSNQPVNPNAGIQVGVPGNFIVANNVTIKYVEVAGSKDRTGTYTDHGIWITGGSSFNQYLGYNYVHDVGALLLTLDSINNTVVEYNWLQNNQSTPAHHAEGIGLRCWGYTPQASNITIRYNYLENVEGTAYIATPCSTQINPSNWAIYGNVFFYNAAEANGQGGTGDGWLSIWNFSTFAGYLYVYNNTISSLPSNASCSPDWAGTSGMTMGTVLFQNNLVYGCSQGMTPPGCPGTCTSYTFSHTAYFNTPNSNDSDPNKQSATSNPFLNVAQTVGANDFRLVTATRDGAHLSLPFNLDLAGNTRGADGTWDRGAYEFTGTAQPPNPPTNLVVQ